MTTQLKSFLENTGRLHVRACFMLFGPGGDTPAYLCLKLLFRVLDSAWRYLLRSFRGIQHIQPV